MFSNHPMMVMVGVGTPSQVRVIREVADSRTPGIFIRDTAYFHCDSMNYE